MNRKQKICLWIGVVLIVLMAFFPPNELACPRMVGPWLWWEKLMILILHKSLWNVRFRYLNFTNLFMECAVVVLIITGLIYACGDKKPKAEPNQQAKSGRRRRGLSVRQLSRLLN